MIIVECLWKFIKNLFYCIARPIVWLLTARDCKRCEHTDGWGCCTLAWSKQTKCRDGVHRCHFKRRFWFR